MGSNDGNIYLYDPDSSRLINKLSGHESTVCSINGLPTVDEYGRKDYLKLISGSWDNTIRVWWPTREQFSNFESFKLTGHTAAVWTVCFVNQVKILTGSADKTVKIWNLETKQCIKTIDAHSDCVRDLKSLDENQFLSCSNDATIKRWNLDGQLLQQYDGHSNYIYSISLISNDENKLEFATCSEDKTLIIWKNGKNHQSIRIPSTTLWSVCKLKNNDLVVGCSNGNVYVYTRDPQLHAPESMRNEIKEEVAKTNIQMSELGDIKVDKLPDKNGLNVPGNKEGETKLIKDGQSILAYQWNASKYEWVKIGDVVGAANANNDPSQKKEYEGQLYDFIFSVDIEEGKPALKLPYNIDQNPYMIAQQFIDKHKLSQGYLEEIANFIIKNSQGGNAMQIGQQEQQPVNLDPFTGGSSYRTAAARNVSSSTTTSNNQSNVNDYYPLKGYFLFETINLDGIAKKLKDFSNSVPVELQLTSADLKSLLSLTDLTKTVNEEQIELIKRILKWPQNNLFPVLDFVRMAVLLPKICEHLCNDNFANNFFEILLQSATNENSTPNQYLSLRCLCNLFKNAEAEQFLANYTETILNKMSLCIQSGNKNVQVAVSTLFMNFSLFLGKRLADNQGQRTDLALNAIQMLQAQFDSEAQFRSLVTLGTILEQDKHMGSLIKSEELFKFLKTLSSKDDKIGKCSKFLIAKLNA